MTEAKEDKEFETEYRNAYGDMDFERMARVLSARLRQMDKRSKAANIRADKAEARNAELVKPLEASRQILAKFLSAGYNYPPPTYEEIDAAFWSVDAALGGHSDEA